MKSPRRVVAALTLAVALSPWAMQMAACGSDAVGIEACKDIEQKRCELAPKCYGQKGAPRIKTEVQVDNCVTYYKDHCLVGIENTTDIKDIDGKTKACTTALTKAVACHTGGALTMVDCPDVAVDDPTLTPCAAFASPEHLADCAFIETPSTATTTTTAATTSTSTGGDGGGGAGGGNVSGGLSVTSGGG